MTELGVDPPGDGPPRDRLAEIKRKSEIGTLSWYGIVPDVRWLVGEVERLRNLEN